MPLAIHASACTDSDGVGRSSPWAWSSPETSTVEVVIVVGLLAQREPPICMSPVGCRSPFTPTEPPAVAVDGSYGAFAPSKASVTRAWSLT